MKINLVRIPGIIVLLAILSIAPAMLYAQFMGGAPSANSAFSIPTTNLMQPAELNRLLHTRGVEKPLVLQVGSRLLFAESHIPGAEYAGAGSQPEGLSQLQSRAQSLPRKSFIVLYCGCCPWNRCPNVGPAFRMLAGMGFTRVKVLYMANNFGADWAYQGYPVESSR